MYRCTLFFEYITCGLTFVFLFKLFSLPGLRGPISFHLFNWRNVINSSMFRRCGGNCFLEHKSSVHNDVFQPLNFNSQVDAIISYLETQVYTQKHTHTHVRTPVWSAGIKKLCFNDLRFFNKILRKQWLNYIVIISQCFS